MLRICSNDDDKYDNGINNKNVSLLTMITMMTAMHTLGHKLMLMTKTKQKANKTINVDSRDIELNNSQPKVLPPNVVFGSAVASTM